MMPALAARAARLRALHAARWPLVLPNAWDAGSGRAVVAAGFPVVATTSGGVALALGWADHEQMPPDEMFAAIWRMARALDVPVTADIEAGYGLGPEEVAERLLAAGAVGCNVEDTDHGGSGLRDAERHAAWLAAFKAATRAAGVDVVLNARVDVFIRQVGPPAARLAETLRRARLYLAAGADCLYPIGVADEQDIAVLVAQIEAPVNAMVFPKGPPLQRLRELGVRRISFATGLYQSTMADFAQRVATISAELESTSVGLRGE